MYRAEYYTEGTIALPFGMGYIEYSFWIPYPKFGKRPVKQYLTTIEEFHEEYVEGLKSLRSIVNRSKE